MARKKRSPYETLGVDRSADAATIRKAHRKRAKETHPDAGGDEDEFREVQHAYELVIDPARRKRFDETGDDGDRDEESDVRRLLAHTFMQVVQQLIGTGMNVESRNVFKAMGELFRKQVHDIDQQIGSNQDAQRKLKAMLKRIKKEPEPHLFRSILNGEIAKVDAMNANLKAQMATMEEAIRHVNACEYECDAHPGFTFPASATMWTFKTG